MKYRILTTVEIEVADEATLNSTINTINTFVENNNGTGKHLIRTVEDEPQ